MILQVLPFRPNIFGNKILHKKRPGKSAGLQNDESMVGPHGGAGPHHNHTKCRCFYAPLRKGAGESRPSAGPEAGHEDEKKPLTAGHEKWMPRWKRTDWWSPRIHRGLHPWVIHLVQIRLWRLRGAWSIDSCACHNCRAHLQLFIGKGVDVQARYSQQDGQKRCWRFQNALPCFLFWRVGLSTPEEKHAHPNNPHLNFPECTHLNCNSWPLKTVPFWPIMAFKRRLLLNLQVYEQLILMVNEYIHKIPGSSRHVKFLPFLKKITRKAEFLDALEDPGVHKHGWW